MHRAGLTANVFPIKVPTVDMYCQQAMPFLLIRFPVPRVHSCHHGELLANEGTVALLLAVFARISCLAQRFVATIWGP